ncbi:MAG: molybdenum cofactor guanylyltransferase [Acidimicrobiales bacterium]
MQTRDGFDARSPSISRLGCGADSGSAMATAGAREQVRRVDDTWRCAGILLTGGASRRMGSDKAVLVVDGITFAERAARVLSQVAHPCVEVGPGHSRLARVREAKAGEGPLQAVATGWEWLRAKGHRMAVMVLACDMPFLTADLLAIVASWPGEASAIPVIDGMAQTLCARYSPQDLDMAVKISRNGERSMRSLITRSQPTYLDERALGGSGALTTLADMDTVADLRRHGLDPAAVVSTAAVRSALSRHQAATPPNDVPSSA